MTRKVLVTGGAGFIGSALVRRLLDHGWQVVVYDNISTGKIEFLPQNHESLKLLIGDIRDFATLVGVVQSEAPELVFHLAAIHYIPYCNAHPLEVLRVNVDGTAAVLEACQATPPVRLVFASTAAVYPAQSGRLSESVAPAPLDIYGLSKYFGEQLVESYHYQKRLDCVIARLFNVYGPRETNPHLIPELVDQLLQGASTVNLGNLEPKRDYVYVEDVAKALYDLALLPASDGETSLRVNIATGTERSALDVVHSLEALVGKQINIFQDPARMRRSDRPHLCGDPTLLDSLVGWTPSNNLENGLRDTWNWTVETTYKEPIFTEQAPAALIAADRP